MPPYTLREHLLIVNAIKEMKKNQTGRMLNLSEHFDIRLKISPSCEGMLQNIQEQFPPASRTGTTHKKNFGKRFAPQKI